MLYKIIYTEIVYLGFGSFLDLIVLALPCCLPIIDVVLSVAFLSFFPKIFTQNIALFKAKFHIVSQLEDGMQLCINVIFT